jgi:tripeptidyl-peptidase-1
MRSGNVLFAFAAASIVDAAAYQLESLNGVPEGWTAAGHPDPSTPMFFRIAMTQPNQGLFEQTLSDISTPGHSRYGQHLKRDQLKAMLRPSADATAAVMAWLTDAGVSQETIEDGMWFSFTLDCQVRNANLFLTDGEWINFVAPNITVAEKMMDTEFGIYKNNGITKIRTLHYSIPENLRGYVQFTLTKMLLELSFDRS